MLYVMLVAIGRAAYYKPGMDHRWVEDRSFFEDAYRCKGIAGSKRPIKKAAPFWCGFLSALNKINEPFRDLSVSGNGRCSCATGINVSSAPGSGSHCTGNGGGGCSCPAGMSFNAGAGEVSCDRCLVFHFLLGFFLSSLFLSR
jgi:hypothetical protein